MLRVAMRGFSVVSQLILVRLLTPADFGLAAASSAASAILDGLTETSMGLALVQMRDPKPYHYRAAWTLIVLRGLLVGVMLWAIAPVMAGYLRDPRVEDIMRVLAFVPMLQGFESIGIVRLQRELRFNRIFVYQLLNKGLVFIIALSLVFAYHNYWALVLGGVFAKTVMVPFSYVIAPSRPGFSLRGISDMFNFSKLLLITNFLTMADTFMIPMIMGRIGTLRDVGVYQVCRDLASLPASEIAAPIRGPMYAGFARVAHDARILRYQLLTGIGLLIMVIVPMSFGIAVTAPYIVPVALGPQWAGAEPILALAAMYALFDAIGHASGGVYLVRNAQAPYVRIMAGCVFLRLSLVVPAAMMFGLSGAMSMMALTAILNAYLWFNRLLPLVGLGWRDMTRVVWRSFAATGVMVVVVALASLEWPRSQIQMTLLLQWVAMSALGVVVHIVTQYVLWRLFGGNSGPESLVIRKVGQRLSTILGRSQASRRPAE